MSVKAREDRRFRRARVTPVRRRRVAIRAAIRGLRAACVVAGITYGAYLTATEILQTAMLRIDQIVVRGNERLSAAAVQELLRDMRGQNILRVDLDAWRQRLMTSPWVADATLRRVLPSTIEIVVAERRPIGVGRLGGGLYLVDPGGTVIDEYGPGYAHFDLPIIDGLAAAPGESVDLRRIALAARLVDELAPTRALADLVSQIDVSDPHDAVVILDGDPAVVHLGTERFTSRLQSYVELAPTLRGRVPEIDYVDMRFEERVYVRPAGSGPRRPGMSRRP